MRRKTHSRSRFVMSLGAVALIAAALSFGGLASAQSGSDSSHDDDAAGKIASFNAESGMLTIDLARGGTVSGLVTKRTWIDSGEDCDRDRRPLHGWCRTALTDGHDGDDDHGWDDRRGSTDDLVEGAVVDDAWLILKDGRAFYAKVELED